MIRTAPSSDAPRCAFGGPDLTDLYITTAGDFWPSEYKPPGCDPEKDNVGGALYRVQLDIPGKPEQRTRF